MGEVGEVSEVVAAELAENAKAPGQELLHALNVLRPTGEVDEVGEVDSAVPEKNAARKLAPRISVQNSTGRREQTHQGHQPHSLTPLLESRIDHRVEGDEGEVAEVGEVPFVDLPKNEK